MNLLNTKKVYSQFRRFVYPHIVPHKKGLIVSGILLLLIIFLQLPLPLLTKYIIDTVLSSKDYDILSLIVLGLSALILVNLISNFFNTYLIVLIREKIMREMKLKNVESIIKFPIKFFDDNQPSELLSRIGNDISSVSVLIGDTFIRFIIDIGTILVGTTIILMFHWKLALITLSILPLYLVSLMIFNKKIKKSADDLHDKMATSAGVFYETIGSIRLMKSYLLENYQMQKLATTTQNTLDASIKHQLWFNCSGSLTGIIGAIAPIIVLYYGGMEIMAGNMTLGTLVAFNTFLGYIYGPTQSIFALQGQFQTAIAALDRIEELFKNKPENNYFSNKSDFVFEKIEFRNISFSYNSHPLLRDFSLNIMKGEKIAIIGQSGIGKSTLSYLLLNFYQPQKGSIFISDINISEIPLNILRNLVTIIPQQSYLFSGSIYDNISMGNDLHDRFTVIEASKSANAHEFISKLPEGYDSKIGFQGVKLSGGERQRINIARAFLRKPEILIIDEALSEVDIESENIIQKNFERILSDTTIIYIAHRVSSIKDAKRIIVLEKGNTINEGTHSTLYSNNKFYQKFYNAQQKQ